MKNSYRILAVAIATAFSFAAPAAFAQDAAKPAAKAAKPAANAFATPEDAVKALIAAVRAADKKAVIALMGPGTDQWMFTGDDPSDKEEWTRFLTSYDKKNMIVEEGKTKATLVVGDDWPFPVPLAKKGDKWHFDAAAGRTEVLYRRVGRNELDTIQTLLAVADAQREYAYADADGNGTNDYARKFISTAGKKDGLYWPTKAGEAQSPLGPLVGEATREGYTGTTKGGKPVAYHGYHYRMLTSQGKDAAGGAYNYLVKDRMMGGFAALAYPATYRVTGVMTFIVNHDGTVYEADLGADTSKVAAAMTSFNPASKTWKKVQ